MSSGDRSAFLHTGDGGERGAIEWLKMEAFDILTCSYRTCVALPLGVMSGLLRAP